MNFNTSAFTAKNITIGLVAIAGVAAAAYYGKDLIKFGKAKDDIGASSTMTTDTTKTAETTETTTQ